MKKYPSDINGAVAEICEVHGLDLCRIQYDLLDKWLPEVGGGCVVAGMDETIAEFNLEMRDRDSEEETNKMNFIRCAYLAQGRQVTKTTTTL